MTAEEIVRAVAAMNPLDDFDTCAFCCPLPKEIWDSGGRHRPDCLWLAAVAWVSAHIDGRDDADAR